MYFSMHINWTSPAISSFSVVGIYVYLNILFSYIILNANSKDCGQTSRFAAYVLGLQFLSMSFKKDAMHNEVYTMAYMDKLSKRLSFT